MTDPNRVTAAIEQATSKARPFLVITVADREASVEVQRERLQVIQAMVDREEAAGEKLFLTQILGEIPIPIRSGE